MVARFCCWNASCRLLSEKVAAGRFETLSETTPRRVTLIRLFRDYNIVGSNPMDSGDFFKSTDGTDARQPTLCRLASDRQYFQGADDGRQWPTFFDYRRNKQKLSGYFSLTRWHHSPWMLPSWNLCLSHGVGKGVRRGGGGRGWTAGSVRFFFHGRKRWTSHHLQKPFYRPNYQTFGESYRSLNRRQNPPHPCPWSRFQASQDSNVHNGKDFEPRTSNGRRLTTVWTGQFRTEPLL